MPFQEVGGGPGGKWPASENPAAVCRRAGLRVWLDCLPDHYLTSKDDLGCAAFGCGIAIDPRKMPTAFMSFDESSLAAQTRLEHRMHKDEVGKQSCYLESYLAQKEERPAPVEFTITI